MTILRTVCLLVFVAVAASAFAQDTIDLREEWAFAPDTGNVGVEQAWAAPDYDDADWARVEAGVKWEDQGFAELDGYAWYRRWVDVPAAWHGKRVWLVLGGVNDCGVLFANGVEAAAFGDETGESAARVLAIADLTKHVRPGERNLLALRVYDRLLSGGLWRLPCLLTTDAASVPQVIVPECFVDYAEAEAIVRITQTGLTRQDSTGVYAIELRKPAGGGCVARCTTPMTRDDDMAFATLPLPRRKRAVEYLVCVEGREPTGELIPGTCGTVVARWPEAAPARTNGKALNNLVTELITADWGKADESRLYSFETAREGWVYVGVTGAPDAPHAVLDRELEPMVFRRYVKPGAWEAMRFVGEGRHTLVMDGKPGTRLTVRAIRELTYCYIPSTAHLPEQGPYDWPFLERHVLPHVNVLVAPGDGPPEDVFNTWHREGRHWLNRSSLPGLHQAKPVPATDVAAHWRERVGTQDERYRGLIIDEFAHVEPEFYREWVAGLKKLSEDPLFARKTFYAWTGEMYEHRPADPFQRIIHDYNHRFAWEQYLTDAPSLDFERCYVIRRYVHNTRDWQRVLPDVADYLCMCLGYFSAPPTTLNVSPESNFNVGLDMQFRVMATDPVFADLYGMMTWGSAYADEETLRLEHLLFRHYCIEGNTEPMLDDPYELHHVRNPDFEDGLDGWEAEPATEGSIETRHMRGFSWLQGRYPRTGKGETFLWMKRHPERANRVRQTMRGLEPGRLYSVKLMAADLRHLDVEQPPGVSLELAGGEWLEPLCFRSVFRSHNAHAVDTIGDVKQVYMTYHRRVFRANGATAELAISDWASAAAPGGFDDQELACNFVEVQPYHAAEQGETQ